MHLGHVLCSLQVFQSHVGSLKVDRFGLDAHLTIRRQRRQFFLQRCPNHVLPSKCLVCPIYRLLHHCHIVNIRDNSYHMREHQEMWPSMQASEA